MFIEAKSINQFGWFWIIGPSLVIIPEVDFSSSSYQTIQFRLNRVRNKFSILTKQLNLNSIEATHSITKQIKIQRHSVSDPEAPVQKLHYSTNLILSWRWGVVECRCPDVLSSASSVCLHPPGEGEARRTEPGIQEGRLAMSGNVELRIDRGKQLYPRFAVMWKPGEFTEESSVFYKPRWRREASSPEFQQKYWRTKTTVRRGCPIFPSRCRCSPWLSTPQSRSSRWNTAT